jgi:hypothetical protein
MGIHEFTRLTTTWIWEKPSPSSLKYYLLLAMGAAPNIILSRDSKIESLKIVETKTFGTLEAHNFLCRPPIEVRSKAKL